MSNQAELPYDVGPYNQYQSRLCVLPPEIRLMIWRYLLVSNERRTDLEYQAGCECENCYKPEEDEDDDNGEQAGCTSADPQQKGTAVRAIDVRPVIPRTPLSFFSTTKYYLNIMETCQLFYLECIKVLNCDQRLGHFVEFLRTLKHLKNKDLIFTLHHNVQKLLETPADIKDRQLIGVFEPLRCRHFTITDLDRKHYQNIADLVESDEPVVDLMADARWLTLRLQKVVQSSISEDMDDFDVCSIGQDIEVAARAFDIEEFRKQESRILSKIDELQSDVDTISAESELEKVYTDIEDYLRADKIEAVLNSIGDTSLLDVYGKDEHNGKGTVEARSFANRNN